MKIYNDSIIYIVCPSNSATGGPETLHQLAYSLKKLNKNVYMYYYTEKGHQIIIPEKFKKYQIPFKNQIIDNENNILIIPEVNTEYLYKYINIQKIIWWLSVDFYSASLIRNKISYKYKKYNVSNTMKKLSYPFLYSVYLIKNIISREKKKLNFQKDKDLHKYFHFYNCQYCLDFLLENGVRKENTEYLCGPISDEFFNSDYEKLKKENIAVYNPKKGFEITQQVIQMFKEKKDFDISFVPLQNMNNNEIIELLKKSKIYMDFGFFPGPERIPREAVLNYCNLITSKFGSAKNEIDVPIPQEYKFDANNANIEVIYLKIKSMLKHYELEVKNFDIYRKKVVAQVALFENNIKKIFDK